VDKWLLMMLLVLMTWMIVLVLMMIVLVLMLLSTQCLSQLTSGSTGTCSPHQHKKTVHFLGIASRTAHDPTTAPAPTMVGSNEGREGCSLAAAGKSHEPSHTCDNEHDMGWEFGWNSVRNWFCLCGGNAHASPRRSVGDVNESVCE